MFTLHSRLLPAGFSWQLSQQSDLHWGRWEHAIAPWSVCTFSLSHSIRSPTFLSKAMFTWCTQGCRKSNGFSHSKAVQKNTGFPHSPNCRLCLQLVVPPSSLGEWGRALEGTQQPGDLVCSLSHVERSRIKVSHRRGERVSAGCPAWAGCQQAQLPLHQTYAWRSTYACGWKSWGRRQKYMDAWRVRQVGTLPLHDVAGWDRFCVHSMADLPCLQIPLHWTAMRNPNILSKVRGSFIVLVGWWGWSIPGCFVAPQSQ